MTTASHSTQKGSLIGLLLLIFAMAGTAGASANYLDSNRFEQRSVRFTASADVIEMPKGYGSVVFDSTLCVECKETLPDWRFIGDLKIDSLLLVDGPVDLSDSAALSSVAVHSEPLIQFLETIGVVRLTRRIPIAHVGVQDFWDDIRKRQGTLPDLSIYYEVTWTTMPWLADVLVCQQVGGICWCTGTYTNHKPIY